MNIDTEVVTGKHERASFLLGVPTLGMVPIEFAIAFTRLQMPVNSISHSMVVTKTEIGVARDYICKTALGMKPRPKYVLFIGDDHIPPWDAAIKLWQEMETGKWDVLSALYYMKQKEVPMPIAWREEVCGPLIPHKHYEPGEVISLDVVPMDFTIIRTSFLEKLELPYFLTGPSIIECNNGEKQLLFHTEDVYFCDKVKKAGGHIGCHTGIRVGHLDCRTGEVY